MLQFKEDSKKRPAGYSLKLQGVTVIERNDSNYDQVVDQIVETIEHALRADQNEITAARKEAAAIAKKAEWRNFFTAYLSAYDYALRARNRR